MVPPMPIRSRVSPSGFHLNFSPRINGERIALQIIVTLEVEAISRMLPRLRPTKQMLKISISLKKAQF